MTIYHNTSKPWKATAVDTSLNTMTGGRVKWIQEYVGEKLFLLTYGDGICDVDIGKLVKFHRAHGKLATLTAVVRKQQKGVLTIDAVGAVKSFREKQEGDSAPINDGFMVLEP